MVLMPQMGVSEESAVLANWMVKEGDEVKVDQVLFVLETGKSTFECKSEHNGFVLKLFANEGDEVNVGVAVCAIGAQGEKVDAPAAKAEAAPAAETAAPAAIEAAPAAAPAAELPAGVNMVLMPQMGVSEESAVLANWMVKEGDEVKVDQVLFVLETGKSTFECQSEHNGFVLKLFANEGDEVNVGVPVCAVGPQGVKIDAPAAAPAGGAVEAAPAAQSAAPAAGAAPAPKATAAMGEGKASPRAKNLAAEMGVNVFAATPTGPNGRIIERDVRTLMESGLVEAAATPVAEAAPAAKAEAAAPAAAAAAYEDKPLSKIRKVIAENMHKSLSEMAQLTLNRTFDATAMIELRKKFKNSKGYGLENVTLNDFILFAVSRTLLDFPELNAYFMGDKMRCFNNVNLAVAVDTPRGLMVPVIPAMEKLNIGTISNLVKEKAAQCKDGSINPAELSGGSFTVTNLGSMGIESFTPVINLPQTAILGVGTFQLKPRENADGEIEFYQAMGLSLTFDHRAVDGSPAAKFLKVLAERLENIELTLAL